jgi:transposase
MTREELIVLHSNEKDHRLRDRIMAVIHSMDGYSTNVIAALLLKGEATIYRYLKDYERTGKFAIHYKGRAPILTEEESSQLFQYLRENMLSEKKQIIHYVKETFHKILSATTCYDWLKRNGFSYKLPDKVPAKADSDAQQKAVEHYEKVMTDVSQTEDEVVLFMDAAHPTQSLKTAAAWLQKGIRRSIPTSSARIRLNIISAIDLEAMHLTSEFYETINEDSVCNFFIKLRREYKKKGMIHMFLDNAAYHKTKNVLAVAKENNITLHFLPPHSPNLNPTERVWKVMNKHTRNNVFFETANLFRKVIKTFIFETFNKIGKTLTDTINDCFQVIKYQTQPI